MTSKPSVPPPEASIQGTDLGYYSHLPVLARALAMTTGPVLELGMGWGSTPLLHGVCEAQGKLLRSIDTDLDWLECFKAMNGERHHCRWLPGWDVWDPDYADEKNLYGLIFIDCAPGEIRKDLALKLKDHAEFIILHDHEAGPGAAYYYEEIIPRWKYVEVYRLLRPHTLILSDTKPFGLSRFEQGFAS